MHYCYLSLLVLLSFSLSAQPDGDPEGTLYFTNPSFEDAVPRVGAAPRYWRDCGFAGESAVDIQPDPQLEFRVVKPPQDGKTYLGMVTRDNDTYERVSQQLSAPMEAGQCYELRIQLARSEFYLSKSRLTNDDANYVKPVKLRIRGGYGVCDLGEIIGESPLVENWVWKEYRIKLQPQQDYSYIVLEAYYKQPILFPYNGNILLDNAKPLVPVACDQDLYGPRPRPEDAPMASAAVPEPASDPAPITQAPTPPPARADKVRTAAQPAGPLIELGNTRGELKIGQVFEIDDITFQTNSATLEDESVAALDEIADFLRRNTDVVVEIGGHASQQAGTVYATRISEARAVAVIEYLQSLQIGTGQLLPRGYGKTRPVCLEDNDNCNQRNQRVEVKILKIRSR